MKVNQMAYGIYQYGGGPDECYLEITPAGVDAFVQDLINAKNNYLTNGVNDIPLDSDLLASHSYVCLTYVTFTDSFDSGERLDKQTMINQLISYTIIGLFILTPVFALIGLYAVIQWLT